MMEKYELSMFSMRSVFKKNHKNAKASSLYRAIGGGLPPKQTNEMFFSITLDQYGMHNYTQQLHRLILFFLLAHWSI